MLPQQVLERLVVATHDGLGRCLECGGRGLTVRERIEMRGEGRPAQETVRAREHELRIGQHAAALRARQGFDRELLDLRRSAIDALPLRAGEQRCHPAIGPRRDGARLTCLDQILGELAVLLEVRTGRKWQCALRVRKHTKLLSVRARLSACFGLKEVRRSIVPARGWARPFPRTGCAPSAPRTLAARIAGARPTWGSYEHRPPCFSSERNRSRRGRDVAALYSNSTVRSRPHLCADRAPPRRSGAAPPTVDTAAVDRR